MEEQKEYFVIIDGERTGPLQFVELREMYSQGELTEKTLVWTKSFGDEWKPLAEVSDIRAPEEPPIVPDQAIPNRWLYLLISVPFSMAFIEVFLIETLDSQVTTQIPFTLVLLLYWVPNAIFGALDERVVTTSGRKDAVKGIRAWIYIFVPVYIYKRSQRTGRGTRPLFAWIGAAVLGGLVTESLPSLVYMGAGVPSCDSPVAISTIREIYPDIPLNVINAEVLSVHTIKEVSFDDARGVRECAAILQNSLGVETPVIYTITDQGDQFYVELSLEGEG